MDENKIIVTYHLEENRVTQSAREFYLPSLGGDEIQPLTMNHDMTSSYEVCGCVYVCICGLILCLSLSG